MKIKLEPKWVYGRTLYYPRCAKSRGLSLLGNSRNVMKPSFVQREIDVMKAIDIEIELVATDPNKEGK